MAMATMPQAIFAGISAVTAGASYYDGANGLAIGYSTVTSSN